MADRSRSSDLEDPLQVYNGLWLFPRTLKSLTNSHPPPHPNQSDDLRRTHSFLESMPLQIRSDHLDQAKAILDGSSKLLDPEISANVVSKDENEGAKMNPITTQRERRPGLGRKRARFSLKPSTSQPTPSIEPIFDVSKYKKPEDFFSAYEKFENAKREWQKQTGTGLVDRNHNQPSMRLRRPGIVGRKRVSYNHRYSTDAINLEASNEESLSPSEHTSLKENTMAHVTNVDRELADAIIDPEKKVDNILGELLACTQDELDGDGAVNLLEERLQIKPINVEKLSLPELQDVRKIDLNASRRNPSKSNTVSPDIQNILKGIRSGKASKNTQTASPLQSLLASVSSLKRYISLSNPLKYQYSFPDSNHLLPDVSTRSLSQQSNELDAAKDLNICSRSSTSDTLENGIGNSMDDGFTNGNSIRHELNLDMQAEGNDGGVSGKSDTNGNSGRSEIDTGIHAVEPDQLDTLMEELQGATGMDDSTVVKDGIPMQLGDLQEQQNEQNEVTKSAYDGLAEQNAEEHRDPFQVQTNERRQSVSHKRSKTVSSEDEGNKRTKTVSHKSERSKQTKRVSRESKETKQRKTLSRESKAFSCRKSLAAAGTKWESGIRRSTRIKSRPLEYWKGERFLYGRIHQSLATVIGIKYESPARDKKTDRNEKPALKVKSFVSDEYKELVELAALH